VWCGSFAKTRNTNKDRDKEVKLARIAGIEIPNNKRAEIGLTYIFGIGRSKSKAILEKVKVDINKKVKQLSTDEVTRIRKYIESEEIVEGDLKKSLSQDIKRLMEINCYRGRRHQRGLPVRGQRTKTNARTRKGPRGSMIKKKK
jgi:small subunit ribosomal protein S13